MDQERVVGERVTTPSDQSMPSGIKRPFISGQLLATWPGVEARDPRAVEDLHEQDRESEKSGRGEARRPVLAGGSEAAQVERDPDQRAHDRQRQQQMRATGGSG